MSVNHLKSKLTTLEIQVNFLKRQIEGLHAAKNSNYKSLAELKGVWKSSNLTTAKELKAVEMDLEKDLL